MIYFDSDMSKSTNRQYTLIERRKFIFTLAENVAHNLCCQWKSQSNSPAHVLMRLWITRSFVNKAKEGGHVRIIYKNQIAMKEVMGQQHLTATEKVQRVRQERNIQSFVADTLYFENYNSGLQRTGSITFFNHVTNCGPRSGFSCYEHDIPSPLRELPLSSTHVQDEQLCEFDSGNLLQYSVRMHEILLCIMNVLQNECTIVWSF